MYNMGYYLADAIYPVWQIMMKTIPGRQYEKQKWFAKQQKGQRKDVEWGFAAVQVGCGVFFVLTWLIDVCHIFSY